MLIYIVIICLIPSTLALFHHKIPPHNRIHVCLTPSNTMFKVEKHITECRNEAKSNIFHEAFSLIHHTAYHHPDEHVHVEYKGEPDEYKHNFTLTEQEIFKFFENHDHPKSRLSSGHLGSTVEVSHEILPDPLHSHEHEHHPITNPHALEPIVHHPPAHGWQQPYPDIYKM